MTSGPPTQDDLAAGRELDALVAEIMGAPMTRERFGVPMIQAGPGEWGNPPDIPRRVFAPPYSTDIGAAWQVVEWAEASPRGWKLTLMRSGRSLPDYVWICTFHRGHVELARVVERSTSVAICKAALQAVSG